MVFTPPAHQEIAPFFQDGTDRELQDPADDIDASDPIALDVAGGWRINPHALSDKELYEQVIDLQRKVDILQSRNQHSTSRLEKKRAKLREFHFAVIDLESELNGSD